MGSLDLERLDAIVRAGSADSAELRGCLKRLLSSLKEKNERSSSELIEYVTRSLHALARVKGGGNFTIRTACLQECVLFFWQHGDLPLSFEAASLRHQLAVRGGLADELPLTFNGLAIVAAELGNISDAISYYSQGLNAIRQTHGTELQGMLLSNLGSALHYAGLYRESIPCLTRANSLYRPDWTRDIRRKALTNLALNYYGLEQFDAALEQISTCLATAKEPSNSTEHFDRALRESVYALIAIELRREELARDHAQLAFEHARASGAIRSKWMAQIAIGRYEVIAGNRSKGLEMLERNLDESAAVDSSYRDALMAIVKAYDDAGMPETALKYMERLLGQVRLKRAEGVEALFALHDRVITPRIDGDISPIEYRHAKLRALVAERSAANTRIEMLERLAITADLKEDASGEHGYRVGKLSALLASRIGWSDVAAQSLELAARLHDIGKTGIPDRILGSSQALKEAERHLMQAHASIGAELLSKSDVPQIKMAEEIARRHHECWDGSGYPDGLRGHRIPVHARIVAIADVFDALTHGRPYAAPWTADQALGEIRALRGTQFDPDLTDAFLGLMEKLRAEHRDLDGFLALAGRDAPLLKARRRIRVMLEEETRHELVAQH